MCPARNMRCCVNVSHIFFSHMLMWRRWKCTYHNAYNKLPYFKGMNMGGDD